MAVFENYRLNENILIAQSTGNALSGPDAWAGRLWPKSEETEALSSGLLFALVL